MADIVANIHNSTTSADFNFSIENVPDDVSDAEAMQILEAIRDSDLLSRYNPVGTLEIDSPAVTGLTRVVEP